MCAHIDRFTTRMQISGALARPSTSINALMTQDASTMAKGRWSQALLKTHAPTSLNLTKTVKFETSAVAPVLTNALLILIVSIMETSQ